jgi:hypothetical protein
MLRGSLDVDLTVDKNVTLKSLHHYLVKLCKHPPQGLYGWIFIQRSTELACT